MAGIGAKPPAGVDLKRMIDRSTCSCRRPSPAAAVVRHPIAHRNRSEDRRGSAAPSCESPIEDCEELYGSPLGLFSSWNRSCGQKLVSVLDECIRCSMQV